MSYQNWLTMQAMIGGLLGAFLLVLGIFAGVAGAFLLHNALGSPFTGIGVFDTSIEFDGHILLINENVACAVLLCFCVVTSITGAMMLVFAVRRGPAREDL